MFEKIAELLAKLNGIVLMAIALGIVALVFIIGLIVAMGGELSKFKKVAKKAIKEPTLQNCNSTAKQLPVRVRKQYKTVKQTGCKPDDAITPDACVYAPFKESAASHFPGAVMAAGILSILLSVFVQFYIKDIDKVGVFIIPAIVTVAVMIFRLVAGLISTAVLKSGVKVYGRYVEVLGKVLGGGTHAEAEHATARTVTEDIPFARADESRNDTPEQATYSDTFDAPERITVELADEEPEQVYAEPEQVYSAPAQEYSTPVVEEPAETVAEPVMTEEPQESPEEIRARARAEAIERMRAEQAQREAAAQAAAQVQAAQTAQAAQSAHASTSADDVIARIEKINKEGASLATMKEVALLLQKERAKPENKTPEQQRKLNEALASLLKAMSTATRK